MCQNYYIITIIITEKRFYYNYNKLIKKEVKIMSIINEISEFLQKGRAKNVKALVQQALDDGVDA